MKAKTKSSSSYNIHRIYTGKETGDTKEKIPYAYVDGSYNSKTKTYGYGAIISYYKNDKLVTEELSGCNKDKEMATMRNVAGELMGVTEALKRAFELELPEITIYYDYTGIEMWATGKWKRNKTGTIKYHEFIQNLKKSMKIHFVKVTAHTGVAGNERVDVLAKDSVGIKHE